MVVVIGDLSSNITNKITIIILIIIVIVIVIVITVIVIIVIIIVDIRLCYMCIKNMSTFVSIVITIRFIYNRKAVAINNNTSMRKA